jgi:hypothetical protein
MVGSGGHGANTVVTLGKTGGKVGRKETVVVTRVVDTLEEGELLSIRRIGRVDVVAHILDTDVGVSDNIATLEILRGNVVGDIRVGEFTVIC